MRKDKNQLIFTDLDGTLLDHHDYSMAAALPALRRISQRGIMLAAVSSKTAAEIEVLSRQPFFARFFIAENGSAIFFPQGHGLVIDEPLQERGDFQYLVLGSPYAVVVEILHEVAAKTGTAIRGYADMTVAEVARMTGLDEVSAGLSHRRDFSEPFIFCDDDDHEDFIRQIEQAGLRCVRGGRFWHAMGPSDKGSAVRRLTRIIADSYPESSWQTLGLGDSPNDIDMLRAVDIPVVVRRPDGSYMEIPADLEGHIFRADGVGPEGWNTAVNAMTV